MEYTELTLFDTSQNDKVQKALSAEAVISHLLQLFQEVGQNGI